MDPICPIPWSIENDAASPEEILHESIETLPAVMVAGDAESVQTGMTGIVVEQYAVPPGPVAVPV